MNLEFLTKLADARSLLDIVHLSNVRARDAFEVASSQNRELWGLAQKVAIETTEPIKARFDRLLHKTV